MAVLNFAAPILPGKIDQWKAFLDQVETGGARRAEWEDQMRRFRISRQVVSLQQTPHGDFAVVMFEGDDPGAMMAGLAGSSNEFDKWFAQQILEIHGIDASEPPPGPMSETVAEVNV